jgi:hypothetical protein
MRDHKLSAAARALALGFTLLAFASAPASAQSNDNGAVGGNNTATTNSGERRDDRRDDRREYRGDRDDHRDWGWLGLLGLGGLLGLMPRKRVPVVHESRDVPGRDPRDHR